MHSHLAIIGKNGELALNPDQSLTITEKNPMFNDVEMFTQVIPLPFDMNRRVLKNMDDVNSTMRSADVQGERFQFVLDGIPFRNTAIKIQEDTKLDDTIDVNFDATNRTFKDMIQDMRCRDVTVDDNILIGEKIGDVNASFSYYMEYRFHFYDPINYKPVETRDYNEVSKSVAGFDPPATGFSYPGKCTQAPYYDATIDKTKDYGNGNTVNIPIVYDSYINVATPYGIADAGGKRWPYCNSRICYAHHDIDEKGKTTSDVVPVNKANPSLEEDHSPYWVLPANRPASGLCFFVGYFLERLFKQLGVAYDMTALTSIEDFNYLAFFSTACKYDTKSTSYFQISNLSKINQWLSDRGCGGQIAFDFENKEQEWMDVGNETVTFKAFYMSGPYAGQFRTVSYKVGDEFDFNMVGGSGTQVITKIYRRPHFDLAAGGATARIFNMFANSDNFPDAGVTEIIESLENAFGVRFCYNGENNKVTVRLLRDMFRDQQAPIHFKGTVLKMVKMTEGIRGVRVRYSAEADAQEQRDNIRYGKRDYDTDFDYCEYPEGRVVMNKTYAQLSERVDSGDMNVYVIPSTGNAIRVKVDKDASTVKDLKPVMFEVGQFHGIEEGDCGKQAEDDDAIRDITIGFTPLVVNDVNFRKEGNKKNYQPMLVPYIDEDMEHEFVECRLQNIIKTDYGEVYFNYILKHYEAYDPTSTDDGLSPLQHYDWGVTLGIMRTGDGGAGVENFDPNYDGFGNWKWRDIADNYCMSADTMDQTGLWLGKTDKANTFSLKIRAYKPFRYKDIYEDNPDFGPVFVKREISTDPKEWDDTWLIPCDEDERDAQTGMITCRIRSRGLADVFLPEYIHFLLERQKYYVEALCTAAELADIPNNWLRRWEIDGKVGWINVLTYPIDVQTGLGKVEIEFYAL